MADSLMDSDFLQALKDNSTSREEILKTQLETQQKIKLKTIEQEKEAIEQLKIETDKLYSDFIDVIKEVCIEASKNGFFITRNGKNEIHGFIAQTYEFYSSWYSSSQSSHLTCYVKEFAKNNWLGNPQFTFDYKESIHKSKYLPEKTFRQKGPSVYDKHYGCNKVTYIYNSNEEKRFINFIQNNISNIVFVKNFKEWDKEDHGSDFSNSIQI